MQETVTATMSDQKCRHIFSKFLAPSFKRQDDSEIVNLHSESISETFLNSSDLRMGHDG